ncbi:MAG: hypothetical protein K1060chlam2_00762 [Chlamydiae bacterium]|nr:hypothetical protein [Chlamydiota bacterium]
MSLVNFPCCRLVYAVEDLQSFLPDREGLLSAIAKLEKVVDELYDNGTPLEAFKSKLKNLPKDQRLNLINRFKSRKMDKLNQIIQKAAFPSISLIGMMFTTRQTRSFCLPRITKYPSAEQQQ